MFKSVNRLLIATILTLLLSKINAVSAGTKPASNQLIPQSNITLICCK